MSKQRFRGTKHFLTVFFFAVIIMVLTAASAMASEKVSIKEGTYYIKATNGNAKGQVLYWNEDTDQNIPMMFESSGGKHADNEIWFITENRNFKDYYGIYLYRTYYGNKDKNNRIEIDNLTGRDEPYIDSTKGPHVFCGPYGNQDDAFQFFRESGNDNYKNLSIWSKVDGYRFNRHKVVKLFKSDLIYVNANKDNDTNNKLWELVPVNYVRSMSTAAMTVTAKANGETRIDWAKFRARVRSSKAWKNAKYIEIQYSTDENFLENVKTKKIKKGTVDKKKAKSKLAKIKRDKTYYVHARLLDKKGVVSNWSKTIEIKAKR